MKQTIVFDAERQLWVARQSDADQTPMAVSRRLEVLTGRHPEAEVLQP